MKKCLFSKNSCQEVPDSLEGEVAFDGILDKFRECYADLYNSADASEEMSKIKFEIDQKINGCFSKSLEEAKKITPSIVKNAAIRMKPNKTDVSGYYSSDVFLMHLTVCSFICQQFFSHSSFMEQ